MVTSITALLSWLLAIHLLIHFHPTLWVGLSNGRSLISFILYTSAQSDAWHSAYSNVCWEPIQTESLQGFLGLSYFPTGRLVCSQQLWSLGLIRAGPSREEDETQDGLQFQIRVTGHFNFSISCFPGWSARFVHKPSIPDHRVAPVGTRGAEGRCTICSQ